ncbi:MAG: hypothetical protein P8J27_15355 [Mariniblastus sp.]|nr:hypothetical protein [Mariniblastus sp.]
MKSIRQFLCLLMFAVWFGGFTFYIAVVVPTGTQVLGSARIQGFVTQQVTWHLNWITAIAVVLMLWEVFAEFPKKYRRSRMLAVSLVIAILVLMLALVWIHGILNGFLDFENRSVRQKATFYQWHRLYLWISTIQWALGILFAWLLVKNWTRQNS